MNTFRSFWAKGPLSPYECLCLGSFIERGHPFHLYSYERIDVPKGVTLHDAGSILPQSEYFNYGSNAGPGAQSPAAFSNRFRYELLNRFGDWWADTDVICLRDDLPEREVAFAFEDEGKINGAILHYPAGHPFGRNLLAEACKIGKDMVWGQAGPRLITRVAEQTGLRDQALPPKAFYPIHYREALVLMDPNRADEMASRCEGSYFLHLWNEVFRRAAIRKEIAPPEGSYLDRQCQEHGISFPSGLRYSHYEIERIMDVNSWVRLQAQVERDHALREIERLKAKIERMRESPWYRWTHRPLNHSWRKVRNGYRTLLGENG